MMRGLMQDWPLTLNRIIQHAARWHGDREVVSRRPDGSLDRTTYADVEVAAQRFSSALLVARHRAGRSRRHHGHEQQPAPRMLVWDHGHRRRLPHAQSPPLQSGPGIYRQSRGRFRRHYRRVASSTKLAEILPACPSVRHVIVIEGVGSVTNDLHNDTVWHDYDALVAAHPPTERWGEFPEDTAAGLCFTSGTTSRPKGVLYSHRSNFLHTLMALQVDVHGLSARDVILPIVPMFHANAWASHSRRRQLALTWSCPARI